MKPRRTGKGSKTTAPILDKARTVEGTTKILNNMFQHALRRGDYMMALFMALSTASMARAQDLLRLRVRDLRGLKAGEVMNYHNHKSGKTQSIVVDDAILLSFRHWVAQRELQDHDFLFTGRFDGQAAHVSTLSNRLKHYAGREGVDPARIGTHSMRKTSAWLRRQRGADIFTISKSLGHSHVAVTQVYLGHAESENVALQRNYPILNPHGNDKP